MVDVARLAIVVDSTDAKDSAGDLDRLTAAGARAEGQTKKLGRATGAASDAARRGRADWRQIGLQLNQVSQQTAATGNFMQALAIQSSDILMFLGPLGIAAGIAAPAILGMGQAMFGAADDGRDLADALDNLKAIMERNAASAGELAAQYGMLADEMRDAIAAQAEIAKADAASKFAETIEGVGRAAGAFTSLQGWSFHVADMQQKMDLAEGEALELGAALIEIVNAPTPTAQIEAMSLLSTQLEEQYGTYQDMPPAIQDFYRELQTAIDLGSEFASVGREAAEAWMDAFGAAGVAGGRGNVQPNATDILMMRMGGEFIPGPEKKTAKRKGGGGGRRAPAIPEGLREAERLFADTRTAAEKYAIEVERINDLHARFPEIVTDEVRDRAIAALEDSVDSLSDVAQTLEQSLADMFTSILTGAKDAREAVADLLAKMGELLIQKAMMGIFGGTGGFFAGLIPGFAEGTNSAPGGLALVGEKGPELVNLPKGSQVMPNDVTRGILGQQQKVNVNLKNVNIVDPDLIAQAFSTGDFERAVVNVIQRNRESINA